MSNSAKTATVGPVERLVRRDQFIVAFAVGLIVVLAGIYTIFGVGMTMSSLEMTRMARPIGEPMSMGATPVWTLSYAALVFFMWWIMMIAMMTPSAAPMILLYAALKRIGSEAEKTVYLSLLFLAGYLAIWAVFSAAATGIQLLTEAWGLSDGAMMAVKSRNFAAAVFVAAGVYQVTGLKEACLRYCQTPAHFLTKHRHAGALGAFRTGARHGIYCLGCCWALMLLLFVGGVMNLYWIVAIAIYVLLEKVVPNGRKLARITGVCLIGFGGYLLIS